MEGHNAFISLGVPVFDPLPLFFRQHLVQFVGVVQQKNIVFFQGAWLQIHAVLGGIYFESVFVSEYNQPAIDRWNVRMAIVTSVGIHEHFEASTSRCRFIVFMGLCVSQHETGED